MRKKREEIYFLYVFVLCGCLRVCVCIQYVNACVNECVLGHGNINHPHKQSYCERAGKLGTIVGVLDNMGVGLHF